MGNTKYNLNFVQQLELNIIEVNLYHKTHMCYLILEQPLLCSVTRCQYKKNPYIAPKTH